jgi:hypothetical protein
MIKTTPKLSYILLGSLSFIFLIGFGSDKSSLRGNLLTAPTTEAEQNVTQMNATIANLPALEPLIGSAKCDVTVMQINYQTPGVQPGEMSNASAALLVPGGVNCPSGPYPLVAYARGTAADKAHTNTNINLSETQVLMAVYASQGYVVVATDYLGYALSNYPYHPYMHADTEASTVIDSIRAVRNAAPTLGLKLNGKVMLSGFSQGGHAAMVTQRTIEQENSDEFNVVATAHLAGPYEVSKALIDGVSSPIGGVQALVPFQITSWQKIYGDVYTNVSDVFKSPYDGWIETLLPMVTYPGDWAKLPTGTPEVAMNAILQAAYLNDLANNPTNNTIKAAKKQDALGWNPKAPTTLCAGNADPVVKFFNAQDAYNDFTSRGVTNVSLVDVDSNISQTFGSVFATNPVAYFTAYHGTYEAQFCTQVAKKYFDLYK